MKRIKQGLIIFVCNTALMMVCGFATAQTTPQCSEETPPCTCDSANAVWRLRCFGSYCDNKDLNCDNLGLKKGTSYWTPYFDQYAMWCNSGDEIVDALDCQNDYCSDIALHCVEITGPKSNCAWVGPISDGSDNTAVCPGSGYIDAVECDGSNCGNLYIHCCEVG